MYGLLLEGIRQFISSTYGIETWTSILEESQIDVNVFVIHDVYDEEVLKDLIRTASNYCHISKDELMFQNGKYFISFLSNHGYDAILRVLGRDFRDFLNGLDNLHEYLRFSYPKLKPPSFFCVNESKTGITLQYRTQRSGFVQYVRGQIEEIAKVFYHTKMETEIITENIMPNNIFNCILRLHFDNPGFPLENEDELIPAELFFEVFPFNIIFNRGLRVVNCGKGMRNLVPDIIGDFVDDVFYLNRPIIEIDWDSVSSSLG